MAQFLNTAGLNEWIPKLIQKAEQELIIIVPYIKTSDRVFKFLKEANDRNVNIILIYRENKLNQSEKEKLISLKNLNLMHHPNVHAKCFFTEKYLIISSMNLYEYSELNNREMGVLLCAYDSDESTDILNFSFSNDEDVFIDAVEEIRQIVNAANIEYANESTKKDGFKVELIKTDKEKVFELCSEINKVFANKKFEPVQNDNSWDSVCFNYFDKINILYSHRMELKLEMESKKINALFDRIGKNMEEYMFDGFKVYWNNPKQDIYLYINRKDKRWKNIDFLQEVKYEKEGLDKLIQYIKENLK